MKSLSSINKLQLLPTALFVLCLIMTGVTFDTTVFGLFSLWQIYDGNYGHGSLVMLTSLVLILRKLNERQDIPLAPSWIFALPLMLLSGLIALAQLIGVDLLQYILLPMLILFAFMLIAGVDKARTILMPLGLVYFAVPFWDYLNEALVQITSTVVQYFIARSGITAYISGNSIFIPSGELVIAAGCSGLRYFIIGTFLGVLGSYLNFVSLKRQLLLIVALSGLSLVANWVRVYWITLVAYQTEMQSPLVRDHEFLGWVIFMSFMMPLLILNGRYQPAIGVPVNTDTPPPRAGLLTNRDRIRMVLAIVLVWMSVSIAPYLVNRSGNTVMPGLDPDVLAPFSSRDMVDHNPAQTDWVPRITVPDTSSIKRIGAGPESVMVFRYLYVRNGPQEEILPYASNIYDRDNWALINSGSLKDYVLLELSNKGSQEHILVIYNFNVGGYTTTSYLLAKLLQFPAVLTQQPYALFTAATISCGGDCGSAQEALADIIHDQ